VIVKESDALSAVEECNACSNIRCTVSFPALIGGLVKIKSKLLSSTADKASLSSNGELFVVIQKKQGMPSAKKRMNELFGNVEVVNKDKGLLLLNYNE
jgi:16S rRNA (guanine1207-N2)-methyltransferase